MEDQRFARTEMLLGDAGLTRLAASSVAVFGVGGVGSFTAEALARAGVGRLTLIDHDTIDVTNINRQIDYAVDAVDTVTAKVDLAVQCQARNIPLIASMGAANKLDPTLFAVMDIYRTKGDPLARILRKKLKDRGVRRLTVVCSRERPKRPAAGICAPAPGRHLAPGSVSFVPPVAGMIMAGVVVRALTGAAVEVSS